MRVTARWGRGMATDQGRHEFKAGLEPTSNTLMCHVMCIPLAHVMDLLGR